jgi:hypothetical protein
MPEKPTSQESQANGSTPPSRPAPPPFRPNKELIGYIEKGQKPPVRPEPSEKR